ncbi:MAG: succinyl-CoA synthetase subunit alpha [Rhodospirillaceae bacterium]|nr:succinyl-CoA synthetase subunit alpha [Rhodospirillaceae bacterium]
MHICRREHRVLVQGITGKQGTFWTERMQEYGTQVVGGVNPKKAGTEHCGVPVYGSAVDAAKDGTIDATVMFIPPLGMKAAALDAVEAGAKLIVCLTEHVPVQDVMYVMAAAREAGTTIIGPNTAGTVTVGECFLGFMPAFNERIFQPGNVGVISRSGSLATLMCQNITAAGFGIKAFLGIGGDPIIGTTTRDALEALDAFEGVDAIAMVGEIGGAMEEAAAEYAATMTKPIAAFIAGGAAPAGKKMGHAGAIVMGDKGTYKSKKTALEGAGVNVLDTPSQVGDALREAFAA